MRDGEIYVSLYDSTKNDWGAATALPEPINSSSSEETFAFVSNDGGVMFFASDRKGGYGGTDIYRSYRLPNGKWGVPQNLGDIINTPYNEDSPIMHPTQNILYFSSAGHNTMGGYDIFFSILNPDSTFAAVSNIGYPINTPDDDVHFVPTTEKNVAYYSSIVWSGETDESSGFDIYEVAYEEPEIEKLVVVEGKIVASADDRIYITAENNGETVGSYQPNSKTNKFVIILEVGSEYTVRVSAGDEEIDRVVTLTEAEAYAKSGETKNIGTFEFKSGIVNATTEGDTSSSAAQQANANSNSQNDSAASTKSSTSVAKASDTKGNDAFTVQILSLREAIDVNKLKGVDASQVVEYQYKDGWFVYSVGEYKSVADVKAKRDEIISTTPYSDAFYRRISQYDKFTK